MVMLGVDRTAVGAIVILLIARAFFTDERDAIQERSDSLTTD
jgi:hypothetical protein